MEKKHIRIFVDGCFDMVHWGHANAFRQVSEHGLPVLGLIPDAEIIKKKGCAPVFTDEERYRILLANKWVHEIVRNVPYYQSVKLLDDNNCQLGAHGDDVVFNEEGKNDHGEHMAANRFLQYRRTEGISTTLIVNKILSRMEHIQKTEETALKPSYAENESIFPGQEIINSSLHTSESNEATSFTWSTCGTSYMPNLLRLYQFCDSPSQQFGFREPKDGDVVVYAPGTYDIFHIGHLSFLEKCLELGNYLLIGLYADKKFCPEKAHMGTIQPMQERLLSLCANKYVCNVVIEAPYVVSASLLDHFKVNIVAVGSETKVLPTETGVDPMKVPKQRGIFRILQSGSTVTTYSIIGRILSSKLTYTGRNAKKLEKELNDIAKQRSFNLLAPHWLSILSNSGNT